MAHRQSSSSWQVGDWQHNHAKKDYEEHWNKGKGKGTKDTWSPGKYAYKRASTMDSSKGEAGKGKDHPSNGEGANGFMDDRRDRSCKAKQPVDAPGIDITEQEVNNMEHYDPQGTPGVDDHGPHPIQNPPGLHTGPLPIEAPPQAEKHAFD